MERRQITIGSMLNRTETDREMEEKREERQIERGRYGGQDR